MLEYQQIISNLQMQVASLKLELHGSSGAKRPIGQDALPDPAGDDDWQVRQGGVFRHSSRPSSLRLGGRVRPE